MALWVMLLLQFLTREYTYSHYQTPVARIAGTAVHAASEMALRVMLLLQFLTRE
jgi:hypothetical protein